MNKFDKFSDVGSERLMVYNMKHIYCQNDDTQCDLQQQCNLTTSVFNHGENLCKL